MTNDAEEAGVSGQAVRSNSAFKEYVRPSGLPVPSGLMQPKTSSSVRSGPSDLPDTNQQQHQPKHQSPSHPSSTQPLRQPEASGKPVPLAYPKPVAFDQAKEHLQNVLNGHIRPPPPVPTSQPATANLPEGGEGASNGAAQHGQQPSNNSSQFGMNPMMPTLNMMMSGNPAFPDLNAMDAGEDGEDESASNVESEEEEGPEDQMMEIAVDSARDKGCQVSMPPRRKQQSTKGVKRKHAAAEAVGNGNNNNSDENDNDNDQDPDNDGNGKSKKSRLIWTPDLHARFLQAVNHLGVKNAVPKTILQLMNVEGMTRENVASHLQKYRLYLKRLAGLPANAPLNSETLQQVQNVQQAMQNQLAAGLVASGLQGNAAVAAAAAALPMAAAAVANSGNHLPSALMPPAAIPIQTLPINGALPLTAHGLSLGHTVSLATSTMPTITLSNNGEILSHLPAGSIPSTLAGQVGQAPTAILLPASTPLPTVQRVPAALQPLLQPGLQPALQPATITAIQRPSPLMGMIGGAPGIVPINIGSVPGMLSGYGGLQHQPLHSNILGQTFSVIGPVGGYQAGGLTTALLPPGASALLPGQLPPTNLPS